MLSFQLLVISQVVSTTTQLHSFQTAHNTKKDTCAIEDGSLCAYRRCEFCTRLHIPQEWFYQSVKLFKKSFPRDCNLLTAITLDTAALNFLFALNFLNSPRFTPRSFFCSDSSSCRIQGFSSAWCASNRFSGLTVSNEEIKSLAPFDTVPQYSS
mmetsp:Transcript_3554/g.3950  ORF Transcript_3554/g.3950 Transcript_3554/m.3950 type:complete len:154 (+) Transcript_3554:57-518(+)